MLLGPGTTRLKGKRLAIVADGALQYIPFEALPVPAAKESRQSGNASPPVSAGPDGNLLLNEHEIVYLPSASVLSVLRDRAAQKGASLRPAAVLADPVFTADDPRVLKPAPGATLASRPAAARPQDPELPKPTVERALRDFQAGIGLARLIGSRLEAQEIVKADSSKRSLELLDFASRDRVLSGDLKDYRFLHFATHALVDDWHPELSGLVLSLVDRDGASRDGYLNLQDIYNLQLSADMVVLSACSTALGKEVRGEGLVGLTRGFMYAGARRVLATLWKVDDEAAAEEMGRLYRNMLGRGLQPAAALRAAKLDMQRTRAWQAPYYWAPFVLQGDY